MKVNTLKGFQNLFLNGATSSFTVEGLCGRIIRGKSSADFDTLTDDPNRKVVMLMGPDGLELLPGKTGFEMLITIGYTADHINRKVVEEGNQFKLVIFEEGSEAKLATWENVIDITSRAYPTVATMLRIAASDLQRTKFSEFEAQAGFAFKDVDKLGVIDSRFMTADRLAASDGASWKVRAFLYFVVHCRELFSGDGYTYTEQGARGLKEYLVMNKPIKDLGANLILDLDIQIPGTRVSANAESYELPAPSYFKPSDVESWTIKSRYPEVFSAAFGFQKQFGIKSPATDRLRVALLVIDNQLTFCHPEFELFVGGRSGRGAIDDSARLCDFIYRNMRVISSIHPTLDTHFPYQVFHSVFLVDANGNHPDPRYPTQVTAEDVRTGKWRIDPRVGFAIGGSPNDYQALQQHLQFYTDALEKSGQYALTVWPFHAMLGSRGHALVPAVEEAVLFHSFARGVQVKYEIKGERALTENYSVFAPEVLKTFNGEPIGQKNTQFLETLINNDVVIIAGQAKSHCVAWTIQHLLDEINAKDPSLAKKVYLLEDCTSSVVVPGVVDFTDQGNEAFERFRAAGMHIVRSTDAIASWSGIERAKLA